MKGRIVSLLVMVGVVGFLIYNSRGVTLPSYFDQGLTYSAALEKSRATGRPVFAYASADWCGPCQEFKKVALRDDRVAAWISANTIPVYLDVTSESSPGVEAAGELGVTTIPSIFLIKDGQAVGSHGGTLDADALLNWLETFSKEPATPGG